MFRRKILVGRRIISILVISALLLVGWIGLTSPPVKGVTLVPSYPVNGSFISGPINFTVVDSDSNANSVEFWIDGEFIAFMRPAGFGVWYYNFTTFALEDGPHYIQYMGYGPNNDTIGFVVFVDNNGPELRDFEINYPQPQESAKLGDSVEFVITAEDEFGIMMMLINCSSFNFSAPFQPFFDDGFHQDENPNDDIYGTDPVGVDAFFSGLFVVNVTAWDTTGNSNLQSYLIEIDNMAPVVFNISVEYPAGQNAVKYGDNIRVTAQVWDIGMSGEVLGVAVDLSSINGSINEMMYDDGLHGDSFPGDMVYGTDLVMVGSYDNGYEWPTVIAYDYALNRGSSFFGVNLDNRRPVVMKIKIDYPGGKDYAEDGDRINVTANLIDDQGPTAIASYYLDASEIGGSEHMENTSMYRWANVLVSAGYTRSSSMITVHVFDHAGSEGTLSTIVEIGTEIRKNPYVQVTSPNGGENWMDGDYYPITWVADGNLGPRPIDLYFSLDNGQTWKPIAEDISNSGVFNWTVPSDETPGALIRVNLTDIFNNTISDSSDASFSIDPPPQQNINKPSDPDPGQLPEQPAIDTDKTVDEPKDDKSPQPQDSEETPDRTPESNSKTSDKTAGISPGLISGIIVALTISILVILFFCGSMFKSKITRKDNMNLKTQSQKISNTEIIRQNIKTTNNSKKI
jgi:hypothetical protein